MEHEEFQLKVVESLARLETHMQDLVGNGKPGRVTNLEKEVQALARWRWIITGGIITVSVIIHFVFRY